MRITATTGKRIGLLSWDLSDNEISSVVVLRIIPAVNYKLQAIPTDLNVQLQARETGSGDPFVDIGATPIDLSGHVPEVAVSYDFRAVAGALTDVRRVAIRIQVVSNGSAAWS
jgi:hypothetical protein